VTVRAFYLDLELAHCHFGRGTLAYDLDHALVSGTLTHDLALAWPWSMTVALPDPNHVAMTVPYPYP